MHNFLVATLLLLTPLAIAAPSGPPSGAPVYNQAAYQANAQFNVSSGTTRNLMTAGGFTTVGNSTAAYFYGNGANLSGTTDFGPSTAALAAMLITNPSSMTNTSAEGLLVISSVTAGTFVGDGSLLTNIPKGAIGNIQYGDGMGAFAADANFSQSTYTDVSDDIRRLNFGWAYRSYGSRYNEFELTNVPTEIQGIFGKANHYGTGWISLVSNFDPITNLRSGIGAPGWQFIMGGGNSDSASINYVDGSDVVHNYLNLDNVGNMTSLSSVTASAFFGDGSHLTGLTDFGPSTATLLSGLYAVGASTKTTNASQVQDESVISALGISTAANYSALNSTGSALTVEAAARVAAEALKSPIASPTFTGTVTLPANVTLAAGTTIQTLNANVYISSAGGTTPMVAISSAGGGSITVSSYTTSQGFLARADSQDGYNFQGFNRTGMGVDAGNAHDLIFRLNNATIMEMAPNFIGFGGLGGGHGGVDVAVQTLTTHGFSAISQPSGISFVASTASIYSNGYSIVQISSGAGTIGQTTFVGTSSVTIQSGVLGLNVLGTSTVAVVGGGIGYIPYTLAATTTTTTAVGSTIFSTMIFAGAPATKWVAGDTLRITCGLVASANANAKSPFIFFSDPSSGVKSNLNIGTLNYNASPVLMVTDLTWVSHSLWTVRSRIVGGTFSYSYITSGPPKGTISIDETAAMPFNCACGAATANGDCSFLDMRMEWLGMGQ